jgi:hypothetical protein
MVDNVSGTFPTFFVPSYAALVNERIVVPSSSTPYFAVEQHFFFSCMQKLLDRIYVDDVWYLQKYPDVREAVESGKVPAAREHYARFGYYEHRLPYPIEVDEPWYLDTYTDVEDSIRNRNYASAEKHFEFVGFREGRLPHPNFKLRLADAPSMIL